MPRPALRRRPLPRVPAPRRRRHRRAPRPHPARRAHLHRRGLRRRRRLGPPLRPAGRDGRHRCGARVRDELGLPISVGVATTKHLAKIASQVAKPDGLVVVEAGTEQAFLDPLPVRLLWGVGPVTEAKLADAGIRTIGELATAQPALLRRLLGAGRRRQARLARRQRRPPPHRHRPTGVLGRAPSRRSGAGSPPTTCCGSPSATSPTGWPPACGPASGPGAPSPSGCASAACAASPARSP